MQTQPDCCSNPKPLTIRVLSEAPDAEIDLRQCASCGAYWKVVIHERPNMDDGPDHLWEWFQQLTSEQAAGYLNRRAG